MFKFACWLAASFGRLEGSRQRMHRDVRRISAPDQYGLLEVDSRGFKFLGHAVAYAVDSTTGGRLAELIQKIPAFSTAMRMP